MTGRTAAVLDLTHGGDIIARSLADAMRVTAVDVYHTLDYGARRSLESIGVSVASEPPDASDFDLIVAPVHLDSAYPTLCDARASGVRVITHHAAVYEIMNRRLMRYEVVEVTGTTAKTSTARLLAGILSRCRGRTVVSHTSAGVEYWRRGNRGGSGGSGNGADGDSDPIAIAKFSIAPASIIRVVDTIEGENGSGSELDPDHNRDPDVLIFEVSLGGTGLADIGIVTTLSGDYPIANGTGTASAAKMQMIERAKPESTLILGRGIATYLDTAANTLTFGNGDRGGNSNSNCNVYFESVKPERAVIVAGDERIEFDVSGYDISSYETAILGAVTAAISIGIDSDCITSFLGDFSGVSGRMRVIEVDGRTILDNSNSGMTIRSAQSAIDHARRLALTRNLTCDEAKTVMIIGVEEYNVCEGLDSDEVIELIKATMDFVDEVITVGLDRDSAHRAHRAQGLGPDAEGLDAGMSLAMDMTGEGDLIISCVKCFR
ncbi:MAG: coenzyme F430 synthase [Methanosarcinales archaeon]|nr:coenzyme F430 synthase [Methanosarcinales archaeon]